MSIPGIPSRGTPTSYPTPRFEAAFSGVTGSSVGMPTPCSIAIFSSSVISLSTRSARSSGERLVFIQGPVGAGACGCRRCVHACTPTRSARIGTAMFAVRLPGCRFIVTSLKRFCRTDNPTTFARARPGFLAGRSLFFDDGQVPRPQGDLLASRWRSSPHQAGSARIPVVEFHVVGGVVEIVVQPLAHAVDAMMHVDVGRQMLIGAGQPGFPERLAQNRGLQCAREEGSLVDQSAGAELILGNRRPFAEEGMVIIRERLGVLGHEELGPVADIVV